MLASLLIAVAATVHAQTVPPTRDASPSGAGSGTISGRITEADSGRPLSRAIVTLVLVGGSRQLEAFTDAQGRYDFTGLGPGEYVIWAGPGEHRSTHLRQAFGQIASMTAFEEPPRSGFHLKPGEVRSGVDIALTRGLAIEGRVIDPRGEPMAEAQLGLLQPNGSPYPVNTSSDDRGEFRLFGLTAGRYRVCATPGPFAAPTDTVRLLRTCYPSAPTAATAADVVLTTSDATGLEIRVQPSGTFFISGSVVDSTGALADSASVTAIGLDGQAGWRETRTNRGRFALDGLTSGHYVVSASIGGLPDSPQTRTPAREREMGYEWVNVAGADVADVAVTMSKGERVAGRVLFEGSPPPALRQWKMVVQVGDPATNNRIVVSSGPSAVNDSLAFELTDLYRLPVIVLATDLPDGWVVKSVRYGGQDITGVATDIVGAGDRRLEIVLTDRVAQPAIRVTDDRGDPVTSCWVLLFSVDPARWNGSLSIAPDGPSADGVVKLGPTLPGEYYMAALSRNDLNALRQDRSRLQDLASVAPRVTLSERDDRTIETRLIALPAARQ